MAVRYVSFNGHSVSAEWGAVLAAAVGAGAIAEHELDSGHRTMAEQEALVREKGVWSPSNPHGAARPSATAPHIRVGRIDHALDVDALSGAALRLARWLRAHGVRVAFTVPTEAWHMEAPAQDLRELAAALGDRLEGYTAAERRWIREYDRLKRAGRDRGRRRVLRRYMTRQRKRIWRAAQTSGWGRAYRRARYRSLLARTR